MAGNFMKDTFCSLKDNNLKKLIHSVHKLVFTGSAKPLYSIINARWLSNPPSEHHCSYLSFSGKKSTYPAESEKENRIWKVKTAAVG